ncbi:MAG: FAD:protein FMN transferase [Myxococcota bacterium]
MTTRAAAWTVAAVLVVVAAAYAVHRATHEPSGFLQEGFESMATRIDVVVPDSEQGREAVSVVREVFEDVDARMSEWKPTSPLSAVNDKAGEGPVEVPADLRAVIRRGIEIGRRTDGAFDITWAALWGLWDFKAAEPEVPPDEAIEERVDRVDFRKVEVDDEAGTVALAEAGMKVGLGGIAKGHALDVAAQRLRELGIRDFLISGGGQVYAAGRRGERPWRVGIRDPRGARDDFFALVEVSDTSLSTSGDYERYFVKDGVRYHHILDPRTGRPARGLRSVTVVTPDATLGDALSTALLVLGPDEAMEVVRRFRGDGADVEAVLVDRDGEVRTTPGMEDLLEIRHPPRP